MNVTCTACCLILSFVKVAWWWSSDQNMSSSS